MGIAVLGPVEVDGQSNRLAPRDRMVLSALVVRSGPLSTQALADVLWGDDLPASWAKVVHGCIARLRKQLGAGAIESGPGGYRLTLTEAELDSRRFERLFDQARDALDGDDPERASWLVWSALDLWRGRALADVEEWEPGRVEATRLDGLRMDAEELRIEAATRGGHARDVLADARVLVAQAPFRERRWALLALALHQAGRQGEALAALRSARDLLVDQLGLDPGQELVELEAQLLRQDPALDPVAGRQVSTVCPYRGLLPYATEHADSFHGRESDVVACTRRLREAGVLAVVGPSGVGKSSLVHAGVVARLVRAGTPVLLTTPGVRPTDSLTELRPHGRQVLVVDQAEELVVACREPAERERYVALLARHVAAGGQLVVSLRADHLGDLAPYPEITRVLEQGLYLLGPMDEAGLREAIEEPAHRAGLRLEPGLVDLLVREVTGEPAALPLLSHVLRETWARREGPTLTVQGYRLTGGVRDAVARTAESLYDDLDDDHRAQLRDVLLRLVTPTVDGTPVRERVPRQKLVAGERQEALLEQLVSARLVSIDDDAVQVAHEALVEAWPRLRDWLDDDVEGHRLFRHLTGAAEAWDAMGRPDGELYRGTRLARIGEWRDRTRPALSADEEAFLAASSALAAGELRATEERIAHERRVSRRLRGVLAGAGVLLVMSVVAGLLAVASADRAALERDTAARERDRAAESARLADARRAGARGVLDEDLAVGLLLTVQGVRVDDSAEAMENLGSALTRTGALAALNDLGRTLGSTGTAYMSSLAASPDGNLVAGCLWASGARLFDAATLTSIPFRDSTTECSSVGFSPDGRMLAVAGASYGSLRLYDVPTGTPSSIQPGGFGRDFGVLYTPHNHVDVAFSSDGTRMAAQLHRFLPRGEFARLGRVLVWDTSDPSVPVFSAVLPRFSHVALSPGGDRLHVVTGAGPQLRTYDVGSGQLLASRADRMVASSGAGATALSPDGSALAVASGDRVVRFDTATLRRTGPVLAAHRRRVLEVAWSHDGRLLATSSDDGTASVWDARSGARLHQLEGGGPIGLAFSRSDARLFTAGAAGVVQAWHVDGASRQLVLGEATDQPDAAYVQSLPAPDGRTVVRVRSGRLWFEDTRTGRSTRPVRLGTSDVDVVWSPDSRLLLSVGGPRTQIRLWDSSTGAVVAATDRFRSEGGTVRAAFGQGSTRVLVHDGTDLHVLSPRTLRASADPTMVPLDSGSLVPLPDGTVLVVHRYLGSYRRVDPEAGEIVRSSREGVVASDDPDPVASPDGTRVVVPGPGVRVRLLDLETESYVDVDAGWQWGVAAFAPDGSQYAVAAQGRLRLWDGRTGDYLASLPLPGRPGTHAIAYRPDSSAVVVTSTDGRTWLADTRVDGWDERACRVAGRNLTTVEWEQFFPDTPYESTCPQWAAGT